MGNIYDLRLRTYHIAHCDLFKSTGLRAGIKSKKNTHTQLSNAALSLNEHILILSRVYSMI